MINYDPPGVHAIGGRWEFPTTVVGKDKAPLVLTGATVTAMLQSGATVVRPATAPDVLDQTASTGQVGIVFLPTETALLRPGRVCYEIRVAFDSANSDIVARGYINAVKTVL